MTTKEQREIIEAYERGLEIEYRLPNELEWYKLIKTSHDFNFQRFIYRVKHWRAKGGGRYYYIDTDLCVCSCIESLYYIDDNRFKSGNYFKTEDKAIEASGLLIKTLTKFHEENE